jgi:hypothetical protein
MENSESQIAIGNTESEKGQSIISCQEVVAAQVHQKTS